MKTKLRAPPKGNGQGGEPILGTPGGIYIGNTQPHDYGKNLPPIGYLFTWDSFSLRMDI